jgi:hypothetical protein
MASFKLGTVLSTPEDEEPLFFDTVEGIPDVRT